ncbi:MAG: hypothetical protein Q8Q14_06615 [Gemmatimonadales bacterium]|nr:hypothetical protein [Gemmatimonadales bacterium]
MDRGALGALLLAGALACDSGLRVVGYGQTGGGGGGTGGGAGGGAATLVGVWRNLSSLVLSSGETVVFDVRWSFGSDRSCVRTRIQTIVGPGGGDETTERIPCTYVLSGGGSSVTVTFQGSSVPSTFSVAFSGGDLLLGGTRFDRIS